MTKTLLIYLLTSLAALRLALHLLPSLIASRSPWSVHRLNSAIDSGVWAGLVVLILFEFLVGSFYVPSGSMEPTLKTGDYILVNRVIYKVSDPARGDMIVFRSTPTEPGGVPHLVKRVVAVGGDVVEIKDGSLHLNGQPIREPFLTESIYDRYGPVVVEPKHVLVLGDDRNRSRDSRHFGPVRLDDIVGRVSMILLPVTRMELFNVQE